MYKICKLFMAGILAAICLSACVTETVQVVDERAADPARLEYLAQLQNLTQSGAMDNWRGRQPMNTVNDINAYLQQFETWARLANDDIRYQHSVAEYAIVAAFKDKIRSVQAEAFSKLRQAAVPAIKQALNLPQVAITVLGPDAREIRFTSKQFRNNDLPMEIQKQTELLLLELRYEKAAYMMDHEDVLAAIQLTRISDDAIVIWDKVSLKYQLVK